jgi:hypothetical protein
MRTVTGAAIRAASTITTGSSSTTYGIPSFWWTAHRVGAVAAAADGPRAHDGMPPLIEITCPVM